MKRQIYSSDWSLTDDPEMNAFKEVMMSNMSKQDDAEVGIFWYDTEDNELFGVKSADVEDINFYKTSLFNERVKTCTPLHYKVWQKKCTKVVINDFTVIIH